MFKGILISLVIISSTVTMASDGILFLAHGSMKQHNMGNCDNSMPSVWEKSILQTISSIKNKLSSPSEVAFGMWNTKCVDAGILRLEAKLAKDGKTLDHLIVLPIFISSHSAVIEMQKFIFKKRSDRVIPLPMVRKTYYSGKITYMKSIDYSPHISMALSKRFKKLVAIAKTGGYMQKEMELVLVMHGPVSDPNNEKWLTMAKRYASDINYLFPVSKTHIISLRDDASDEVRNLATKKLQEAVKLANTNGKKALVLPLLLSKGGIEEGILERLTGLEYIWTGEMLLPDPMLGEFLVGRLKR